MASFVTFDEFLRRTAAATGTEVEMEAGVANDAEFARMRDHLLNLYQGVDVTHSFVNDDGQYIDCVPIDKQAGLRRPDGTMEIVAAPPAAMALPAGAPAPFPTISQTTDSFGNLQRCPFGTIPMRRITLEEMTKYKNLEDFFRKEPSKFLLETEAGAEQHYYAYTYQMIDNFGGSNVLNLWSPVPTSNQFSLSQNWYVGGNLGGTQTVESGWQVYPAKYGTNKPCLFIFWTPDNDNPSGPSAYNLDKPGFVQTDATWVLGGPFNSSSIKGGVQYEVQTQWLRDPVLGHWWFYVAYPPNPPTAVGYYPRSLFGSGQLASNAQFIKYGGEVTGTTASGEMGSGEFASAGCLPTSPNPWM